MLTLTDNAKSEIRNLVSHPEVADEGGVRIASNSEGALTLAVAAGPAEGDQVVEDAGARVFLEEDAGALLDDKTLDAGVDPQGNLQFAIGEQDTSSPLAGGSKLCRVRMLRHMPPLCHADSATLTV